MATFEEVVEEVLERGNLGPTRFGEGVITLPAVVCGDIVHDIYAGDFPIVRSMLVPFRDIAEVTLLEDQFMGISEELHGVYKKHQRHVMRIGHDSISIGPDHDREGTFKLTIYRSELDLMYAPAQLVRAGLLARLVAQRGGVTPGRVKISTSKFYITSEDVRDMTGAILCPTTEYPMLAITTKSIYLSIDDLRLIGEKTRATIWSK